MFEIKHMGDKPNSAKPPENQYDWFDSAIARLGGAVSFIGAILAIGYLVIPLAFSQNQGCSYQGDIKIHPPFIPVFEENCLVMGPPISYIETVRLDGYGAKTIQYFEGALLMAAPVGNSQEVEVYPLGKLLQPKGQPAGYVPDTTQFYDYLAETDYPQFLGQPVTDFLQIGDRLVIYYENSSLRWNPNSQLIFHQSLGREHLTKNYPALLVEGEPTPLLIPQSPIRLMLGNILPEIIESNDYIVDVSVKYPILYSDNQQVVMVKVVNRITNEPVPGLTVAGLARYSDLDDLDSAGFNFYPADIPGGYIGTVILPDHPGGIAGREVILDISVDGAEIEKIFTVKKFETWW